MNDWKTRLKQVRAVKFPKKTDFAKAVGVSSATVTDWEKLAEDGGIKEITGLNLMKVCSVLGIAPAWLLHDVAPDRPPDDPGGGESEMQWVSGDEADLLRMYRAADVEGRRLVRIMADSVTKR